MTTTVNLFFTRADAGDWLNELSAMRLDNFRALAEDIPKNTLALLTEFFLNITKKQNVFFSSKLLLGQIYIWTINNKHI